MDCNGAVIVAVDRGRWTALETHWEYQWKRCGDRRAAVCTGAVAGESEREKRSFTTQRAVPWVEVKEAQKTQKMQKMQKMRKMQKMQKRNDFTRK
ncbi:hypothetical protein F503_07646 [Ophiostoma piceae UAMH 11346]|uniref:Uncharacterized protein n=1 Tax=Ophiostoma piceae (strain UAMH 11346) TaxID=1262450 RepID=S3CAS8_OPHP1|nr:hypothetical protein F503_07646 [Ophiostoma piceae UAMH 11346]